MILGYGWGIGRVHPRHGHRRHRRGWRSMVLNTPERMETAFYAVLSVSCSSSRLSWLIVTFPRAPVAFADGTLSCVEGGSNA
jgi:hypothetical protein